MPAQLTARDEQRLQLLEPDTQAKVRQLLDRMADRHGIRVQVGTTARTLQEQAEAKKIGRSTLKVGWHQLRRAADLYVFGPDGHPDLEARHPDRYRLLHQEAHQVGLHGICYRPYPDGDVYRLSTGVIDFAHVENRGAYQTLAQALQVEGVQNGIAA